MNLISFLTGLESKLGYIESLHVDALVLSSVLDSGSLSDDVDVGYQVINYTNIDPLFGDLQDMDDLIAAAHDKGQCTRLTHFSFAKEIQLYPECSFNTKLCLTAVSLPLVVVRKNPSSFSFVLTWRFH